MSTSTPHPATTHTTPHALRRTLPPFYDGPTRPASQRAGRPTKEGLQP